MTTNLKKKIEEQDKLFWDMINPPIKKVYHPCVGENASFWQLEKKMPTWDDVRKYVALRDTAIVEAVKGDLKEAVKGIIFKMVVDEYLPWVKEWNKSNFDVPFDHGYDKAKKDISTLIENYKIGE